MPLISTANSAFNTTSPKTISVSVQAGDVLVVKASTQDAAATIGTPTTSGAALTWTLRQSITTAAYSAAYVWTAVADSTRSITVTLTRAGSAYYYGASVEVWRGVTVGASNKASGTGVPSVVLTTTAANAGVSVLVADWNAVTGSPRTWNTSAGAASENLFVAVASQGTWFGATYADVGAAGSKTVGFVTNPTGTKHSTIAVELAPSGPPVTHYYLTGAAPTSAAGAITTTPGTVDYYLSGVAPTSAAGTITVPARVDSWRQVIEGAPWRRAVTARERYVGVRVEMIDQASGRHVVNVPVVSGSVSFNGEDAEQWACSFSVVGEEWVPTRADSVLGPVSGLLCRVWWRVRTDASDWMEVPIGTYVLEDPEVTDDGTSVTVSVTGRDPLALIRRTGYGSATIAVGGLDVPTALARIMSAVAPQQPVRIDTTSTELLPAVYELGTGDVGKDLTAIANTAGWVVRTDRDGTIVFGPSPDPDTPRADWSEGPDCVVTDITRDIATSSMVNSVTVVSNNTEVEPPVAGYAEDDDPSSPTYVGGPWGRRGITVQSDVVSTVEAASAYARRVLSGRRRPTESVSVSVLPRGDLGYRDVVSLKRDKAGVAGLYRVGKWSLSIGSGEDAPALMKVEMLPKVTL